MNEDGGEIYEPASNNVTVQESQITLPVSQERLVDFISGLLGKTQTRGKRVRGPFVLTYDDILNTYSLIEQRIKKQNEANLTQFSVSINFDDNSHVRLNSLSEFKSFTEIKPLACTSVTLTWIYIVEFMQKSEPEKQQIDITFNSPLIKKGENLSVFEFSDDEIIFSPRWSGIVFSIDHTERTWGNDIFSLLEGHIQKFVDDKRKFRKLIGKYSAKIGVAVSALIFIGTLIAIYFNTVDFINQNIANYENKTQGTASIQHISDKLNYVIKIYIDGIWEIYTIKHLGFVVFSFVFSIFLGIWVTSKAKHRTQSFILLTDKSKSLYEDYKKLRDRDWVLFYFSVIVSLGVGILSNYIFNTYIR